MVTKPDIEATGSSGFVDAENLAEALATLAQLGPKVTILAGGTDVMVQYLRGDVTPSTLLHVRQLMELKGSRVGEVTDMGALTTHWEIVSNPALRRAHPALAEAAATVGGRQTQNAGTVGGNVVNASPAADLLPALLVSGAGVTLKSALATRELTVEEFVVGRRSTQRRPEELVTRFSLQPVGPRTGETYLKIGRRGAMEVAIVGLAMRLAFDEEGVVVDARVAACAVGPRPFRSREAEARLVGSKLEKATVQEAGELLRGTAAPIDDSRATAAYRSRLLAPLLARATSTCLARASVEAD